MKLLILRQCLIVEDRRDQPVPLSPGDTIDIADHHAKAAILRGLAEPILSHDDARTGAPAREKAAARGAAERG